MKQNIFIISGPSGAGEDSVIDALGKLLPIEKVINTTTRNMRPGESNGDPYYFITESEFQHGVQQDAFIEFAQQYNGNWYGVTRSELERVKKTEKIGIWKMEYKGVISVKKRFPNIMAIFLMAENLDTLELRIKNRDNLGADYVRERMDYTREWLKHKGIYDFTVINRQGRLHDAVNEIVQIIERHTEPHKHVKSC